jgi:uncharacterized protein
MSPTGDASRPTRLDLLDALRGSALLGILLLHAVEHWDFVVPPTGRPAWLEALDGQEWAGPTSCSAARRTRSSR